MGTDWAARKGSGAPAMLLLDHVGAHSGTAYTTPLVYAPDGDELPLHG